MALRMNIAPNPGDIPYEISLEDYLMSGFKWEQHENAPATLSWKHHKPQHTVPLPSQCFVIFWDDEGEDRDGDPLTADNPLFLGHILDIDPGEDSNIVKYTAYDPTAKVAQELPIMSGAWTDYQTEAVGAVPRLILNCRIDNDWDYAIARANDATLGGIISGILDDAIYPLRRREAAPDVGTAWDSAEMAALDFKPQEKIVFEGQSVTSGLRSILRWEPAVRMNWSPKDQKWHFRNLYTAPEKTLTLNHWNMDTGPVILSMSMQRSLEKRATAVRIYGPEQLLTGEFNTGVVGEFQLNTTDSGVTLETYSDSTGIHELKAVNTWQIDSSVKRRGGPLLPTLYEAPMPAGTIQANFVTRSPHLQVSYDGGTTYNTVLGATFDYQNGIVSSGSYLYQWFSDPPIAGSTQHYFNPTNVRLVWPYHTTGLYVRWPSTEGVFEGTAYTEYGIAVEKKISDPMLAVGYERGTAVTTVARLAQYQTLAATIHRQAKDVIYTGGCVLDGCHYDYIGLNWRINLAGLDGDGNALTTGWEAIGAALTGVQIDFSNQTTTLMYSTDQQELMGMSPEYMRERLKIHALQRRVNYTQSLQFRNVNGHQELSGAHIQQHVDWIDPGPMIDTPQMSLHQDMYRGLREQAKLRDQMFGDW